MRKVNYTVKGSNAVDGNGVNLVRVLDKNTIKDFDPFLMLDSFDSYDPQDYIKGFPTHPHRGIETVTYLAQGEIIHKDSLGNKGTIHSGDTQWMTAGSGIMHSEMPQPSSRMLGLQLWINLPKKDKMTTPKYFDISKDNISEVVNQDYSVKIISGCFEGNCGVTPNHLPAKLMDICLEEQKEIKIDTEEDTTVFIFTLLGEIEIDGVKYGEKTAILFKEGHYLQAKALTSPCRIMYFEAPKLNEPIAWGGPIVMNTEEELRTAFKELSNGNFIKDKPSE